MSDQVKSDLIEEIIKSLDDVNVTINDDRRIYSFKLTGASLKSFNKDAICLVLEGVAPPQKAQNIDDDDTDEKFLQFEPKEPSSEPEPEPEANVESNESDSEPEPDTEYAGLAAAQPLEAKPNAANAFVPSPIATASSDTPKLKNTLSSERKKKGKKSPRKRPKTPLSPGAIPADKMTATKATFSSLKVGRESRLYLGSGDTFVGCEYTPNYKGSERGCVLLKSNATLERCGIIRKSQIERINGADVSSEPLKKLRKMIVDHSASGKDYSIQFNVPQMELTTTEITVNGPFCPDAEFTQEYNGNNYIISDIPDVEGNKYLLNQAGLKKGYRLLKVQGTMVLNKPFADTQMMLDRAGGDQRVTYVVVFIEGSIDWYNFVDPMVKVKKPKLNQKKSNKSPRKLKKPTTPMTPFTPSASGKNPKYFLRDKKNVSCYFDLRVDGDKRGRIEIVLFMGTLPKTCTNFVKLCTGENKKGLTYKGKKFYKMYVGMGFEIGDVVNNDGTGASSIYGGYFEDENFRIRHAQYCLSMVNTDEPDTNASQFYIMTANDAEFLDGKNVVFGYIVNKDSQALVDELEEDGCTLTGKPNCKVVISKCGRIKKK